MIDTHCHLDFPEFDGRRSKLLERSAEVGVETILLPGIEPTQWAKLEQTISENQSQCRLLAAAGLHPWWVDKQTVDVAGFGSMLQQALDNGSWVAIGECGLDGSIATPMDVQLQYFEAQIELAEDRQMPLIVHGHKAHNDVLRVLGRHRPAAGGVIHGFSGSGQLAEQYLRLGFLIGVGGTITYPRASKTRNAIAELPLDALLLETDAPSMPLYGGQGQINTPESLPAVAECLAQLRQQAVAEVIDHTSRNAERLFGHRLRRTTEVSNEV